MSFSDLLNKPLPSAKADDEELTTLESADPEETRHDHAMNKFNDMFDDDEA